VTVAVALGVALGVALAAVVDGSTRLVDIGVGGAVSVGSGVGLGVGSAVGVSVAMDTAGVKAASPASPGGAVFVAGSPRSSRATPGTRWLNKRTPAHAIMITIANPIPAAKIQRFLSIFRIISYHPKVWVAGNQSSHATCTGTIPLLDSPSLHPSG
jgi:hypothetical protein